MLIFHDPRCAQYGSGAHPEQPARVRETAAYLRSSQPSWAWRKPSGEIPDEILLLAHTPGHLERLAEPRDFDADTPHYAGIAEHARRSVASAVEAVEHALSSVALKPRTWSGGSDVPAVTVCFPAGNHTVSRV